MAQDAIHSHIKILYIHISVCEEALCVCLLLGGNLSIVKPIFKKSLSVNLMEFG